MSNIPPNPAAPQGAPNASGQPAPLATDQLLPPVEPPSAGFLLQLFVVPMVIVACVVGVWFLIELLARRGEQDPAAILRALRSTNGFQQAKDLADMLHTPERYPNLSLNHDLGRGLAKYLDETVDAGSDNENAITMRYFLVSMLGEMHVADGVPALAKAALKDKERDVRRKAINALAVLAASLAKLEPPQRLADQADVVDALVTLANDKDELVRSEAAFALGVVADAPDADPRLAEALRVLADDPYTDARFNAAVGLARIGSPLAPNAVAEMFNAEAVAASISGEKALTDSQTDVELRSQQAYKRNTILTSALSAVGMLVEKKTPADAMRPLASALEKFIAAAPAVQDPAPIPKEIVEAAKRELSKVQGTTSGS